MLLYELRAQYTHLAFIFLITGEAHEARRMFENHFLLRLFRENAR